MINRRDEKNIKRRLQSEAQQITPENWSQLESKADALKQAATVQPRQAGRMGTNGRKRCLFKFAAVFCALLFFAGALSISPLLKKAGISARAESLYDSSGHLDTVSGAAGLPQSFTDGYNAFGLNLLKTLAAKKNGDNVFISPASVYLALGMTYNGANGQTADEFAKLLGNKGSLADFNTDCRDLQSLLLNKNSGFALANSLWIDSLFKDRVSGDFIGRDRDSFGAAVYAPDFRSPGTPDLINGWVKKNTNGLLPGSVKKISPDTVMYLVNTITFEQPWLEPFDEKDTSSQVFHAPQGDKKVLFMSGERNGYYANDDVESILLPYQGGKTSMLIMLPQGNPETLLSSLTPERVAVILNGCKTSGSNIHVQLSMPKLTLQRDYTLNDSLKSLGLTTAFSDQADFSGMLKDQSKDLYIGSVTHQTYLKVDEQGTTAAGQTTVEMEKLCTTLPPPPMKVDRPYITAIVDNGTGAILFIGCVSDPG